MNEIAIALGTSNSSISTIFHDCLSSRSGLTQKGPEFFSSDMTALKHHWIKHMLEGNYMENKRAIRP